VAPDPGRILNYTTEVRVEKTIDEIKAILRAHQARSVTEVYDGGKVSALEFVFDTGWGPRAYLLPAKPEAVLRLMIEQRNKGKRTWTRGYVDPAQPTQSLVEQAERTAWRTIKSWVEAQMALMATRQVSFEQIFLPYALVDDGSRTMFDVYSDTQKALGPGGKQ
jgi:hypothetical protein